MKDAAKLDRERRAIQLHTPRNLLGSGETASIGWTADDLIDLDRLLIEKETPAYRDLWPSVAARPNCVCRNNAVVTASPLNSIFSNPRSRLPKATEPKEVRS